MKKILKLTIHGIIYTQFIFFPQYGYGQAGLTPPPRPESTSNDPQANLRAQVQEHTQQTQSIVDAANSQKKAAKKKMIMYAAMGVSLGIWAAMEWPDCLAADPVSQAKAKATEKIKEARGAEAFKQSMNNAPLEEGLDTTLSNAVDAQNAASSASVSSLNPIVAFSMMRKMFGVHSCLVAAGATAGALVAVTASLKAKKEIKRAQETINQAKASTFEGKGGEYDRNTANLNNFETSNREGGDDPASISAYSFQDRAIKQTMKALNSIKEKTKGKIAINPTKGTLTINGKEIKVPTTFDKATMTAGGFSAGEADSALAKISSVSSNAVKKLNENPMLASIMKDFGGGDDFSSGGSGMAAFANGNINTEELNANNLSTSARLPSSADANKVNMDGMSKNYNGERIGVASDELFAMINRRYKSIENQSRFLDQ